jgi:hypothetical protein
MMMSMMIVCVVVNWVWTVGVLLVGSRWRKSAMIIVHFAKRCLICHPACDIRRVKRKIEMGEGSHLSARPVRNEADEGENSEKPQLLRRTRPTINPHTTW